MLPVVVPLKLNVNVPAVGPPAKVMLCTELVKPVGGLKAPPLLTVAGPELAVRPPLNVSIAGNTRLPEPVLVRAPPRVTGPVKMMSPPPSVAAPAIVADELIRLSALGSVSVATPGSAPF